MSTARRLVCSSRSGWPRVRRPLALLRALAAGYVLVVAALGSATLLPTLIGWRPYVVSSGSMGASLPVGSVVIADHDGGRSVHLGDVVMFHDEGQGGRLVAHRVVARTSTGDLVTKGDASRERDVRPLARRAVIGRVRAVVPSLGVLPVRGGGSWLSAVASLSLLLFTRRMGWGLTRMRWRSPAMRRGVAVAAVVLVVGGGATWQASAAAFSKTTKNPGNTFAAGSVAIGDDDSGTALFNVSGLVPGDTGSACMTVTYTGSLAASVKLYVSSSSGTLRSYLAFTVDQGSGGSFAAGCGSFVSASQLYNGTLAGFASSATNFASGLGSFTPTGSGFSTVYRFTYTVNDDNTAAGTTASVNLTWEAQST